MLTQEQIKDKLLSTGLFEDCEELNLYSQIIYTNQTRRCNESGYTEKHHWLPRCYFKFLGAEVDNSNDNLVNLLYKDHILAHYYLCCSCSDTDLFLLLQLPVKFMSNNLIHVPKSEREHCIELINSLSNKLQLIFDKKLKIQFEKDIVVYNKLNNYIKSGKTFKQFDIDNKLNMSCSAGLYKRICDRHNLNNLYLMKIKENDISFYEMCNKYFLQNISCNEIDRINHLIEGNTRSKYYQICLRYNFPNKNNYTSIDEKNDFDFYQKVNDYLNKGVSLIKIDKYFNSRERIVASRYKRICDRWGWENLSLRKIRKWTFEDEMSFYNHVALECLKNNTTFNNVYSFEKFKISENYFKSLFLRICQKYNLKNYSRKIQPKKFSREEDISFYENVNTWLMNGLTMSEISKKFGKDRHWSLKRYYYICAFYKLENKILNITKQLDIDFYNKCNEYYKAQISNKEIETKEGYSAGFVRGKYAKICNKYNLPNLNKNINRIKNNKEKDRAFYDEVNSESIKFKDFKDMSINKYHKGQSFVINKYKRICDRWGWENLTKFTS